MLFIITSLQAEDCTHTLNAKYQPKPLHDFLLFLSAFYQFFWKLAVRCPRLYPHKRQVDQTVADRLAVDSPGTAAERQAQEQNELVCTPTLLSAFQTFQNISRSALPALVKFIMGM